MEPDILTNTDRKPTSSTVLSLLSRTVLIFIAILLSACSAATTESAANPISPEPTNPAPPPTQVFAPGDACSPVEQQAQIDASFAEYQAARSDDQDSLLALTEWANIVSAEISTACSSASYKLSDPVKLAELLDKLLSGGYVIYVRHTHTDRSRGDEDVSLGMCDKQRILSDRGRDEALLIRNAYRQLDLPVDRIISTQYCRTLETAVLAFGVPQVVSRTDLHATLTDRLAAEPMPGTNTLIVAHIGTLRDRVGLDATFEEGDSLVYRPTGDGSFAFVGRIGLYDWPIMVMLLADR